MSDVAPPSRRGVRILGCGFAVLFVLLCAIGLVVYFGLNGTPTHWQDEQDRIANLSPAQREAVSESLRNRLVTQWTASGEQMPKTEADLFGQRQVIELPFDELNTWIHAKGLALLAEVGVDLPKAASTAMVDSPGDGLLRVSMAVKIDGAKQVITMSFAVAIAEDGTVTSTLTQATAGRLPLPVDAAISLAASKASDDRMLDLMRGTPLPPLVLPIDTGDKGLRDGRIVGLEVREDALVITRETIRRKKTNP